MRGVGSAASQPSVLANWRIKKRQETGSPAV